MSTKPHQTQTLYFAYGSNLSPTQMRRRCPSSKLLGPALLLPPASGGFWRWTINERGYANVVQMPPPPPSSSSPPAQAGNKDGEVVYGLIYALSERDEAVLDLCEGVPEAYGKEWWDCRLWRRSTAAAAAGEVDEANDEDIPDPFLSAAAANKQEEEHDDAEPLTSTVTNAPQLPSASAAGFGTGPSGPSETVSALVYIDRKRTGRCKAREEYVARMRRAVAESAKEGVPVAWLRGVIGGFVTLEGVKVE